MSTKSKKKLPWKPQIQQQQELSHSIQMGMNPQDFIPISERNLADSFPCDRMSHLFLLPCGQAEEGETVNLSQQNGFSKKKKTVAPKNRSQFTLF
jgi:hypothetical protein